MEYKRSGKNCTNRSWWGHLEGRLFMHSPQTTFISWVPITPIYPHKDVIYPNINCRDLFS